MSSGIVHAIVMEKVMSIIRKMHVLIQQRVYSVVVHFIVHEINLVAAKDKHVTKLKQQLFEAKRELGLSKPLSIPSDTIMAKRVAAGLESLNAEGEHAAESTTKNAGTKWQKATVRHKSGDGLFTVSPLHCPIQRYN